MIIRSNKDDYFIVQKLNVKFLWKRQERDSTYLSLIDQRFIYEKPLYIYRELLEILFDSFSLNK